MYPACWCGLLTAGPDGLRGSGSKHRGALVRRDDRTECPDPGPDHFAVAAWCSLRLSGGIARRGDGLELRSSVSIGKRDVTVPSWLRVRLFLCSTAPVSPSRPTVLRAPRAAAVKTGPPEGRATAAGGLVLRAASTALDWLGRGDGRLPEGGAGGEHGPGDAGGLGGLRQHRDLDRAAGEDAALPRGGAIGARTGVAHYGAGAERQQLSEPDVALAADAALAALQAARRPARGQAAPGGEVAGRGELLAVADGGDDGVRGQTADAGNGREPPHRRVGLGDGHDLGLDGGAGNAQLVDLLQQQAQHRPQDLRNSFVTGRNQLAQLGKAAAPLRRDDAEFGELAAHAVHQLGVLLEQQFPRPARARARLGFRRS